MDQIDSKGLNCDNFEDKLVGIKTKHGNLCVQIAKFVIAKIGLALIIIFYSIAGAFIFILIEKESEAKNCQQIKLKEFISINSLKSQLLNYISNNMTNNPYDITKDDESIATEKIEHWLEEFRDKLLGNQITFKYIHEDCISLRWNFWNSLLFSFTIISTIGIPLFLMCLANISSILGDTFRLIYAGIRLFCIKIVTKNKTDTENKNICLNDSIFENAELEQSRFGYNQEYSLTDRKNEKFELKIKSQKEEKVSVPLTITIIIITAYLLFGAVMFNQFEDWTLIQSAYFCFISLTTIGFGDYVPGQKSYDTARVSNLIATYMYLIIGMAILAMSFDLMQEEIVAKFTWLGKKLSIIAGVEIDNQEDLSLERLNESINNMKKVKIIPNIFNLKNEICEKNEQYFTMF